MGWFNSSQLPSATNTCHITELLLSLSLLKCKSEQTCSVKAQYKLYTIIMIPLVVLFVHTDETFFTDIITVKNMFNILGYKIHFRVLGCGSLAVSASVL